MRHSLITVNSRRVPPTIKSVTSEHLLVSKVMFIPLHAGELTLHDGEFVVSRFSFTKTEFRNTIRVPNNLIQINPDMVRPDLGPNCLMQCSADDS